MTVRAVQRQVVTERLAGHLLATGLARTSVRQMAAAAGVSDRMLLYYFKDKAEVIAAARAAA
jgi:AcrR family transcriptional regulator